MQILAYIVYVLLFVMNIPRRIAGIFASKDTYWIEKKNSHSTTRFY
jgi:hypothetical protein